MNRYGNQMTVREYLCYMCGDPSHKLHECPHQKAFMDKKWIIRQDNRLVLRDGSNVPYGDSSGTRKEKIEKIAKEKGWDKENSFLFTSDIENEAAYMVDTSNSSSSSTGRTEIGKELSALVTQLQMMNQRVENLEESRRDDVQLFNTAVNSLTQPKN
jgi:hypothetical protein